MKRHSLAAWLILASTLLTLTNVLFTAVALNNFNQTMSQTNAGHRAEMEMQKCIVFLQSSLSYVEDSALLLASDNAVYQAGKILQKSHTISEEIDVYNNLKNTLSLFPQKNGLKDLRIYLPDSELVTRQKRSLFGYSDLPEHFDRINLSWALSAEDGLVYYCSAGYTSKEDPVVAMELSKEYLNTYFDTFPGEFFISLIKNGVILYEYGQNSGDYTATELWNGFEITTSAHSADFGEKVFIFPIILGMILIMIFFIPCILLLIANPLNRSIKELADAKEHLMKKDYVKVSENAKISEIYLLEHAHNNIVDWLQELIGSVYEAQHAKDQAELACLFEQIKPHFLYNTLEGGKWLALREGGTETARFLETLSKYYRLGLNKGEPFVMLEQELEHIQQYIALMNMRYKEKIHLKITSDPRLQTQRVLRLLLQPLVENSVEHGLHSKEGECEINILISSLQHGLSITVEDNGSGMPEELCKKFNAGEAIGFGLENIRSRLALYYEKSRIQISPSFLGGTKIEMELETLRP